MNIDDQFRSNDIPFTYREKSTNQNDDTQNRMPHMMISVGPFPIEFEKNEEKGDPSQNSHSDHDRWDNLIGTIIRSEHSPTTIDDVR